MAGRITFLCAAACLLVAIVTNAHDSTHIVASLEARLQRCLRLARSGMFGSGAYIHLAKLDKCGGHGIRALEGGASRPAAAQIICDCVDRQHFPDVVMPFVSDFKDCAKRAFT